MPNRILLLFIFHARNDALEFCGDFFTVSILSIDDIFHAIALIFNSMILIINSYHLYLPSIQLYLCSIQLKICFNWIIHIFNSFEDKCNYLKIGKIIWIYDVPYICDFKVNAMFGAQLSFSVFILQGDRNFVRIFNLTQT